MFSKCSTVEDQIMAEHLITIGHIDASDTLGTTLHYSAIHGNKKAVKRVLDKGIHVDYPNDEGQSPLFCAALQGKDSVVEYLLAAGANPNEKSNSGLTPVHAACFAGHVKMLMKLLNEGGDLRLHDNHGRSVKDWAILQPVPKKRMKMLEFLDKTRLFAMSTSGQDLLMRKASSKTLHRAHNRRNTVTKIIRETIGRPSIHENLQRMATSHHSLGFGQVYSNGTNKTGFLSAIPLVSENHLRHDPDGDTYNNGAFAVMESMWWEYTEVTVKRLHRDVDPYQGGVVDLLINEIEHIGKLRHPHILSLMGVCQNNNLDGLVVIFERIGEGSLYNYLHQKMERLPSGIIQEIAIQMCNALVFIHLRGLIHCAITSHAISVINEHTFKLGNFEYMIETSKCEWGKKNAVTTNTNENAVYNWMAPEVMFEMPPSYYCDMYSYCAVFWEMFHGDVPWDRQCAETIKSNYQKGNMLQITHGKIAEFYKVILSYGLQIDPTQRKLSFLHVRDLLIASPKDAKQYMRTHFKHLQPTDTTLLKPPPSPGPESSQRDDNANRLKTTEKEVLRPNGLERRRQQAEENGRVVKDRERQLRDNKDRQKERRARNSSKKDEDYNYNKTRQVGNQNNSNCHVIEPAIKSWERQSRQISGLTPQKPARQGQFHTNGINWEVCPVQQRNQFNYTVSTSTDGRLQQQPASEPVPAQPSAPEFVDSSSDNNPQKDDSTSDSVESHTQVPTERRLERKTSSMGRFSYLNLRCHQSARTATAKPASHGHTDLVADVYSTAGKLTTAGSLYTLYNEHSPDLPLGQRERREERRVKASTLPRQKAEAKPFAETPDPNWFGGQGSVRNLAKLFAQHAEEHELFQSVIDGTVNKNHFEQGKREDTPKRSVTNDYVNNAKNDGKEEEPQQQNSACSLSASSWNETGTHDAPNNSYQIAYDCDTESTSSSTFNSDATVHTSIESDMISEWVDHELRKIKRNLSKELQEKESYRQVCSPEVNTQRNHENNQDEDVQTGDNDSEPSAVINYNTDFNTGDHPPFDRQGDTFFDDEIYSDDTDFTEYRRQQDRAVDSPQKTSLPMKTILKKSSASQSSDEHEKYKKSRCNKKRLSKIPTPSSRSPLKTQTSEGAYANIVTIRSSCDVGGIHTVTHQMKNLKTGGTHTIMKDTVNAEKIVTSYKAPQ